MQSNGFERGVELAYGQEPKYEQAAYFFLRESLDFALNQGSESQRRSFQIGVPRDVPGQRLAQSFAEFALQNFGPLASVVLQEWGIERSEDVGAMVYLLIELGIFSRGREDSVEDFAEQWTLADLDRAYSLPERSSRSEEELSA